MQEGGNAGWAAASKHAGSLKPWALMSFLCFPQAHVAELQLNLTGKAENPGGWGGVEGGNRKERGRNIGREWPLAQLELVKPAPSTREALSSIVSNTWSKLLVHTCHPSIWATEAGKRIRSSRSSAATLGV